MNTEDQRDHFGRHPITAIRVLIGMFWQEWTPSVMQPFESHSDLRVLFDSHMRSQTIKRYSANYADAVVSILGFNTFRPTVSIIVHLPVQNNGKGFDAKTADDGEPLGAISNLSGG